MSDNICPICGKRTCRCEDNIGGYVFINCATYNWKFSIGEDLLESNTILHRKALNLIFEKMLRTPYKDVNGQRKWWCFFYAEDYKISDTDEPYFVNLAEELKNYPINVAEKINRGLMNLAYRYPNIGDSIDWRDNSEPRLLFCDTDNERNELQSIVDFMKQLGYLDNDPFTGTGRIGYKGWDKINEMNARQEEQNQGFIAMSFTAEAKSIMDTFKKAILTAGYNASVISEKEHNNQIVPEIFYEIRRSKFLVVDVTYPNYGAYYEAGYGQALGKQVIVCCRKTEFDKSSTKPHFDIAQKSMILWENPDELEEQLVRRIKATVNK